MTTGVSNSNLIWKAHSDQTKRRVSPQHMPSIIYKNKIEKDFLSPRALRYTITFPFTHTQIGQVDISKHVSHHKTTRKKKRNPWSHLAATDSMRVFHSNRSNGVLIACYNEINWQKWIHPMELIGIHKFCGTPIICHRADRQRKYQRVRTRKFRCKNYKKQNR